MARPSFSPKNVTPKQHYLLGMGFSNIAITCILRGNINLEFLKSPDFTNNENLLRGWLSIIMHIIGLGNDFIQGRDPLVLHLLRVAEKGNAMLTYVTVDQKPRRLVRRQHFGGVVVLLDLCVRNLPPKPWLTMLLAFEVIRIFIKILCIYKRQQVKKCFLVILQNWLHKTQKL